MYFFFLYFGLVYVSPQHAHSWVVEFQTQNIGHGDTKICPSNVLNALHYTPCLQFLPIVSYRSISSTPLSSYPSASATAHSLTPTISIPSCSHHLQVTYPPSLPTILFQRSSIGHVAMYCVKRVLPL